MMTTTRRPRSTIGVTRAHGQSRIGFATMDGGDVDAVYIRVSSQAEADVVNGHIRAVYWSLPGPRTLSRRRQIVDLVLACARLIDTKLTETEVARLREWQAVR